MATNPTERVVPVKGRSTEELLNDNSYPIREFMLIGGKDGEGKTCACVSIAAYIEVFNPTAKCYVIDSEFKFKSALRSFGKDAPKNISYHAVHNMNEVTSTAAHILAIHKPGDWLFIESMGRIWEQAQDLGYQVTTGMTKEEYLERRPKKGPGSGPIPHPDRHWDIVKGAHDAGFLDLLVQSETLNVCMTTPIAKPKEGQYKDKPGSDRASIRIEHGIDANLEGLPRLPYKVETLILFDMKGGLVSARVLRDNLSLETDTRPEFDIPDRKSFGPTFFAICRGGELRS